MPKTRAVRKGESLDFSFDRGDESIEDFVCTLNVLQYPGDTPAISRVITPVNNIWSGIITSTETDGLTSDITTNQWWAVGVLTKAADDEEEQIAQNTVRFDLKEKWA